MNFRLFDVTLGFFILSYKIFNDGLCCPVPFDQLISELTVIRRIFLFNQQLYFSLEKQWRVKSQKVPLKGVYLD